MCFIRKRSAGIRTTLCALAAAALLGAAPARAAQCGNGGEGFQGWLAEFKREALSEGFSSAVIEASLRDVSYDRSVIAHDRKQGIFHRSFEQFSNRLLTPGRIARGRALLARHAALFQAIERQYGVPGAVLVAIWGLETTYGDDSGNFRTFSALATLAYDCRRSDRFRAELIDALENCAAGRHVAVANARRLGGRNRSRPVHAVVLPQIRRRFQRRRTARPRSRHRRHPRLDSQFSLRQWLAARRRLGRRRAQFLRLAGMEPGARLCEDDRPFRRQTIGGRAAANSAETARAHSPNRRRETRAARNVLLRRRRLRVRAAVPGRAARLA